MISTLFLILAQMTQSLEKEPSLIIPNHYMNVHLKGGEPQAFQVGFVSVILGRDIKIQLIDPHPEVHKPFEEGFAVVFERPLNFIKIISKHTQNIAIYPNLTLGIPVNRHDSVIFSNRVIEEIRPLEIGPCVHFIYFTNKSLARADIVKDKVVRAIYGVNDTDISKGLISKVNLHEIRNLYVHAMGPREASMCLRITSTNKSEVNTKEENIYGIYKVGKFPSIIRRHDLSQALSTNNNWIIIYVFIAFCITGGIVFVGFLIYRTRINMRRRQQLELNELIENTIPPIESDTPMNEEEMKYISAENITPAIPTNEMGEVTIYQGQLENPYLNDETVL
ncbi:hypothetical protein TVAG_244890 [Trichomonas vaginalis G3]|uniref:Peptidase S72 domain-containing protein n=1 Tax=Trichomonas vaginalis (strain ATCC PRA-98 / G3) TaxID=412133 RepID=A2EMR1_TRIV3|nr:hypothetical protein TVAGG3_0428230 [Trichomonas vaginalis G3]EAY06057.1 hypothetical protein TVAG_244890 [Trichomonas vaginalis G3]KAI5536571.1 hypothetical protein TVAGG3_0428230 [Trichomonas vaginalis G3]|eukprot:XP_001318280.1 hypothetical protein [Trichomonas vaginalis G3]